MVSREIFRDIRVMLTTYRGRVDPWKRHESDSSGIGTEYWDGWDIKERKGKEHSDGVLDFALLDFASSSLGRLFTSSFRWEDSDERLFKTHYRSTSNHYLLLSSLLQSNLSDQQVVAGIVCMYVCTLGTEFLYKNRTDEKKKVQSPASSL